MNKIHIMDEILANKIAAGEVVEKCFSVVKELVENSIDAKASEIIIDLVDSGIKEIKVTDNGIGMSKEDAKNAFLRHATSKIRKDDDLFFINTLGFRGEALPSIASVSDVTLKTSEGDVGTLINIKGGQILKYENSDARVGTSVSVKNIFYNTPARLKFLKSESSELASIVLFIEKLALSYPNIKFTLSNNAKIIVKTSGSSNLLKTIHEIYGASISSKMIKVNASNEDYEVSGYICKPEILKNNKNHFNTFVNGRIIRNSDLNRIINDAYYTYKPATKYPIVVLNIYTDPTLIDVNIHPTKQDIKFSKIKSLEDIVTTTIKNALYQNELIPTMEKINSNTDEKLNINPIEYQINSDLESQINLKEDQIEFDFNNILEDKVVSKNEKIKKLKFYPAGLVFGTYIIAQNEDGMYLIDQHAAQERINYEKYLNALKSESVKTIPTMFPINIEMNPSDYLIIKNNLSILENIGFKIEEFGINTFTIKEHPTWLLQGYETEQIQKIIDILVVMEKDFDIVKFNEKVAITLACKMSIKGNTAISIPEMEELLDELVETDNPYNCPHGRPTIITFTKYELEKMFKRAMD